MDPQKRKHTPDFYGYIPDGGSRTTLTVIFGCMMLQSVLLLLIRSFSAAMLVFVNKRYFVMYLAGDMALCLLQKMGEGTSITGPHPNRRVWSVCELDYEGE